MSLIGGTQISSNSLVSGMSPFESPRVCLHAGAHEKPDPQFGSACFRITRSGCCSQCLCPPRHWDRDACSLLLPFCTVVLQGPLCLCPPTHWNRDAFSILFSNRH